MKDEFNGISNILGMTDLPSANAWNLDKAKVLSPGKRLNTLDIDDLLKKNHNKQHFIIFLQCFIS